MKLLMTLAEDVSKTTSSHFSVIYSVDEEDCFAFADGFADEGFDVFFVNWSDFDGRQFLRMFNAREGLCAKPIPLDQFDVIFPYKMENFLAEPQRFETMLQRFEATSALVINDPATIRHNLSKMYLLELQELGTRIVPTYGLEDDLVGLLRRHNRLIVKPKIAERGSGHTDVRDPRQLEGLKRFRHTHIAQAYMPCVRAGEVSMFFLGLTYQASVIKHPNPRNIGDYKCNESLGGTVAVHGPSPEVVDFGRRVLQSYGTLGYEPHYSRVDIIRDDDGPMLMEAELVNPSVYANYTGRGAMLAERLAKYCKTQLALVRRRRDYVGSA